MKCAESTPPEQRAERIARAARRPRLDNAEQISPEYLGPEYDAHPEAVRMPPLMNTQEEILEMAREDGNKHLGLDRDQLRILLLESEADTRCRSRQLLAALTELQTERAAHERTRAELGQLQKEVHEASLESVVGKRIDDTETWLMQNAPYCFQAQRHTEEGTQERVYWHYGYLVALRDVRNKYDNSMFEWIVDKKKIKHLKAELESLRAELAVRNGK